MSYEEKLCQAIEVLSAAAAESMHFDLTVRGTIVKSLNNTQYSISDNKADWYLVRYQDANLIAKNASPIYKYQPGCSVFVLIVGGDFSDDKIILAPITDLYTYKNLFADENTSAQEGED